MEILNILNQHRRDFTAYFKCEHCGHTPILKGYDDEYFHNHVIPNMKCEICEKTAGEDYRPLKPKYAESEVV